MDAATHGSVDRGLGHSGQFHDFGGLRPHVPTGNPNGRRHLAKRLTVGLMGRLIGCARPGCSGHGGIGSRNPYSSRPVEWRCRRSPKRVAVSNVGRLVFVGLYRLAPTVPGALKPRRWKSRRRGGRPRIPADIRRLILELSIANALWGAARIHGELLKLEIDIGQTTVAQYMAKRRRPRRKAGRPFFAIAPTESQ